MSAEREQVDAVLREFGYVETRTIVDMDVCAEKLAAALVEARAESDRFAKQYGDAITRTARAETQLAAEREVQMIWRFDANRKLVALQRYAIRTSADAGVTVRYTPATVIAKALPILTPAHAAVIAAAEAWERKYEEGGAWSTISALLDAIEALRAQEAL